MMGSEVFCEQHLWLVEPDTRRILGRTFRPGKRYQSKIFTATLERAQAEVLYRVTEGHRPPRDQRFMFDDEQG